MFLHNIDDGPVLWKLKHLAPPLDVTDPLFNFPFDDALHSEHMRKDLDLSHLADELQEWIYALIIKYWFVFMITVCLFPPGTMSVSSIQVTLTPLQ